MYKCHPQFCCIIEQKIRLVGVKEILGMSFVREIFSGSIEFISLDHNSINNIIFHKVYRHS